MAGYPTIYRCVSSGPRVEMVVFGDSECWKIKEASRGGCLKELKYIAFLIGASRSDMPNFEPKVEPIEGKRGGALLGRIPKSGP